MSSNYQYLKINNKEFYIIPTAHISKQSVLDTQNVINKIKPDTICVELDEKRYQKIIDPNSYLNQDIVQIIKDKKVNFLLVNLVLASFQKRLAKKLDTTSGQEFITAIELSKTLNSNLVLADRDIGLTFSRVYHKLGFFNKIKLISNIIGSIFDRSEITEEELAELKEKALLQQALNDVSKQFPIVKEVLINERDRYLAYHIKNAPGNKIVAVIGAGHLAGVLKYLEINDDISELSKPIKPTLASKITPLIFPGILIFLFVSLFFFNFNSGLNQVYRWILITGGFSAIGTLIARGHIITILTAFVLAPITTLHPFLAIGFFTGLCEAKLRKPKVIDFENLAEDTVHLKGFFKNNVSRILMIVLFSNLFASIATIVLSIDLIQKFFN